MLMIVKQLAMITSQLQGSSANSIYYHFSAAFSHVQQTLVHLKRHDDDSDHVHEA